MIEVLVVVGVAILGAVLGFVCGRWGRKSCDEQRWFSFTCMCGYRLVTDDPELLTSVMNTHVCSFPVVDARGLGWGELRPSCPSCGRPLTPYVPIDGRFHCFNCKLNIGPQGTVKPGDRPNTTHPEVF